MLHITVCLFFLLLLQHPPRVFGGFVYTTCKRGFEKLLKQQVLEAQPDLRFAFSRPGLLTWKCPDTYDSREFRRPASVWLARSAGESLTSQALTAADVKLAALELKATRGITKPLRLHCWAREGEEGLSSEHPQLIADRAKRVDDFRRELLAESDGLFHIDGEVANDGDYVLDVILGEGQEKNFVGAHTHGAACRTRLPNNFLHLELPSDAPSRAYLKTEEAVVSLQLPVVAGDVAVEIGSSPGGSVLSLLRRGVTVYGVDPCPSDRTHSPVVLGHKSFREVKSKLHQLRLSDLPKSSDWLLCDANIGPEEAVPHLSRLAKSLSLRKGLLYTCKLGGPLLAMQPSRVLQYIESVAADMASGSGGLFDEADVQPLSLPSHRQEILLFFPRRKSFL